MQLELELHDTNHNQPDSVKDMKAFLNRRMELEQQKQEIAEDVKEVNAEAKAYGIDVKVLNELVKVRKQGLRAYQNFQSEVNAYADFLG